MKQRCLACGKIMELEERVCPACGGPAPVRPVEGEREAVRLGVFRPRRDRRVKSGRGSHG